MDDSAAHFMVDAAVLGNSMVSQQFSQCLFVYTTMEHLVVYEVYIEGGVSL
jgi:hypothetical protein